MSQRHTLGSLADLPAIGGKAFVVAGLRLAVFKIGADLHAIDDTCPHEGGPLSEGEVEGTVVTCPWHGAQFDLTCGKVLCGPAVEDVRSYPVFVNAGKIEVEI